MAYEDKYEPGDVTVRAADDWDPDGSVSLPHQCGSWQIGYGTREEVLTSIDALLTDLREARTKVEKWER